MQRSWRSLLPLVILVALIGYLYAHRQSSTTTQTAMPPPIAAPVSANARAIPSASTSAPSASAAQLPAFLPPEARATLALIANGGPFPNRQDGEVFGNYERLLPPEPRGYYHEYTVATPGLDYRGARRIIAGGNPPTVYYYTDDHYRSFRAFTVPR